MLFKTQKERFQFWAQWVIFSFGILPLVYMVSLIVVLLVHGAFGYNQMERGTYFSQTMMQIAGGAVIGLGTGYYQRFLLQKIFHVSSLWIYTSVIGFAITELIVCIILWQMSINRYELRFIEFNPLPEALIFAGAGLITGILQWTILRKYFIRSIYWVFASTSGWGICIFIIYIVGLLNKELSIFAFIPGTLLYGAITGASLIWILKLKR